MTKCIVISEEPKEGNRKTIEFCDFMDNSGQWYRENSEPRESKIIELLCHYGSYDIMLAYNNSRNSGHLIIRGHWNDGIV